MGKLRKEDWIQEGFAVLQEFAQHKLKILYLCDRLKVTRGSFYHHFKSIEDYITDLMKAWEKLHTEIFIELSQKQHDGQSRMNMLNKLVMQADHRIEASIRSWSFTNPIVFEHQQRIDKRRLQYLQKLFKEMGMDNKQAKNMAKIDYAILIGLQQLNPNITLKEFKKLSTAYNAMI